MIDTISIQEEIRDSILNGVYINLSNMDIGVSIKLEFDRKGILFSLDLFNVEFYQFTYNLTGYQYIEQIKILRRSDNYYITLDPYSDALDIPHDRDDNIIIAKELKFNRN
jgi:hypothetical protein